MLGLIISLSFGHIFESGYQSIHKGESAKQAIDRYRVDEETFREWALKMARGRLFELDQVTDFYHRAEVEDFEASGLDAPEDTDRSAKEHFWRLFKIRTQDHWDNASYGEDNYLGTGLYLSTTPFGSESYGANIMILSLPAGTKILMNGIERHYGSKMHNAPIVPYLRGHDCSSKLSDNLRPGHPCRGLVKAALRALGVEAIIYDFSATYLSCGTGTAIMLVDEGKIEKSQIHGVFAKKRPRYLRDSYRVDDLFPIGLKRRILGCGTNLVKVEPTLDLQTPIPPTTGCKHARASPLNTDIMGTLSSMLEDLQ